MYIHVHNNRGVREEKLTAGTGTTESESGRINKKICSLEGNALNLILIHY